jgi:hypothetical protein
MFTKLAAQASELWRFALDGENGKLRLIGEKGCSLGLQTRSFSDAHRQIPRL